VRGGSLVSTAGQPGCPLLIARRHFRDLQLSAKVEFSQCQNLEPSTAEPRKA
jgi:hypothetical protein